MDNTLYKNFPRPPKGKTGWPWNFEISNCPEKMPNGDPWPKISIVTPNYNYGCFIEETIRSVLLQGYPNLEYIVIDGGSTDNSIEIIKKYDPWISYWVSEPDEGQADAINKGFKEAKGKFYNWLNSDDLLMPGSLFAIGEIFLLSDNISWISGYRIYKDNVNFYREVQALWKDKWHLNAIGIPDFPQESTFFTSDVWKSVGGLESNLNNAFDILFFYKMLQVASLGVFIQAPLSIMNIHSDQKTFSNNEIGKREHTEFIRPLLKNNLKMRIILRLLRTRYAHYFMNLFKSLFLFQAKKKFKISRYDYFKSKWELKDFYQ